MNSHLYVKYNGWFCKYEGNIRVANILKSALHRTLKGKARSLPIQTYWSLEYCANGRSNRSKYDQSNHEIQVNIVLKRQTELRVRSPSFEAEYTAFVRSFIYSYKSAGLLVPMLLVTLAELLLLFIPLRLDSRPKTVVLIFIFPQTLIVSTSPQRCLRQWFVTCALNDVFLNYKIHI